jgi:glucosamine--fructose-6-phosphate aminotransferase (isomerizing)
MERTVTLGTKMAAEMAEQPVVLRRFDARRPELVAAVRATVPAELAGVALVARGSSDNAAVFGRYAIEAACGRPVALVAPSLHTLYGAEPDYRGYLVVAVSQSGATPEIVTVTERLAAAGARTVAVTNVADSPLAAAADALVPLDAGEELAVPATKTFSAQLAAFAVIAEALGTVPWGAQDWERLPSAVEEVLAADDAARRVAAEIGAAPGLITVGRGYLYSVALEAALKLKETTSILAEGYSAADLRHGPIAVIERAFPVVALRARGPAAADMTALAEELTARGARVHLAADDPAAALPLPGGLAEPLATIPAVVRMQQLALELARHRGLDPDAPAGLRKVTPTT